MNCKIALALILAPVLIFGNIFSNIPPAKIEIININPKYCDEDCLFELSKNKKIFSFIARFDRKTNDKKLQNLMELYTNEIGMYYRLRFDPLGKSLEVALLMPKKIIGKYSATTIDTILAYLFSRDINFRFKIFDSVDENLDSLEKSANQINEENFNFVIAILSQKESLKALEDIDMPIYIPTMTKDDDNRSNIVFGGIDYKAQIEALVNQEDNGIAIIYNDDSALGRYLGDITKEFNKFVFIENIITNKIAANFSPFLAKQEMFLAGSNVFLNTPVVKSGLLLTQIGVSSEIPNKILSTQVNFNPALLSLIRGNDVSDNILIANSISKTDQKLIEYGLLLTSDMQYDWVNYSTALGVDLFLSSMSPNIVKYFVEVFDKNQAIYNIDLYEVQNDTFVKTDKIQLKN